MRGAKAKENVLEIIKKAFGNDYIGVVDKKIYISAIDDGGERVQIALAMTCPKVMIETVNTSELNYNTGRDFTTDDVIAVAPDKVEISDAERENVRKLMQRMGL